jgi:DNA-binding response OmpR family regulator
MNKRVVLLVDDQETMAQIVVRILQKEGFEVMYAPNGIVALELVKTIKPDIVLCDINMPEMDGYHFLKSFKEAVSDIHVPFLFLTANDSHAHVRQGMNLGADDYLCKPITRKELLHAISLRLDKAETIEQELEKLTVKYAEEIAKRDDSIGIISGNKSQLVRIPLANILAIVDLIDTASLSEKNNQLLSLLQPLTEKLETGIRENVRSINISIRKDLGTI